MKELDKIVDKVFAYKPKSEQAKKKPADKKKAVKKVGKKST